MPLARALQGLLEQLKLDSYPKTSGKRGLHVFVPIAPGHTYAQAHTFAQSICGALADRFANEATTVRGKALRNGRLYLDAEQNARLKTMVAPYSLRAIEGGQVSAPLTWDESGTSIGVPVIVMSRLAGAPLPRPTVPGWVEGFASTLARIASADVDVRDLPVATSWREPNLSRPDWFTDDALWVDATTRADTGLTGSTDGFIHRDFHPLNVL